MRWLKILGIVLLVVIGLFVGLVVYVANMDLSRYKGTIEEAVTEATGREFRIDGRFGPCLGRTTSLVAEDVILGNATWSNESEMIRVDRFAISLDFWSLLSGSIRIHNLEIKGARLLLESDPDKGDNWQFVPGQPTEGEAPEEEPFELRNIVFEQARVEDFRLSYRDAGMERPLDLLVERLHVKSGESGLLDAVLSGKLNEYPLQMSGELGPLDNLVRGLDVKHSISGSMSEVEFVLKGTIGDLATLEGTSTDLDVSGSSLRAISRAAGLPQLPDAQFELRGHFEGSPEAFSLPDFNARLGKGDLRGSFTLDLREKPAITGEFTSDVLDLSPFFGPEEADGVDPEGGAEADVSAQDTLTEEVRGKKEKRLLISDEPLPFEHLDKVDLDIRLVAKRLIIRGREPGLLDVNVGVRLEDQRLHLDPLTASDPYGGSVKGTVLLEPVDSPADAAARMGGLEVRADLKQIRPRTMAGGKQPEQAPPTDISLTLKGSGVSLHSIMSNSNGRLQVVRGEGQIENDMISLVFGSVIMQLFRALNPFSKEEPYTKLECSVTIMNVEDGIARVPSLVIQTDKLGIIGRGEIDFETEKINLDWDTKPREGLGISSGVVVNPFIKLGGTLAKPAIALSPVRAAGTTGAAVATFGLTLGAKAFWDRVTGEGNLCNMALKKAAEKSAEATVETGSKTKEKNASSALHE